MIFIETHPELAGRDCNRCKVVVYDPKTGQEIIRGDGTPEPRPIPPNCEDCLKSRVDELLPENHYAYMQYVVCQELSALPRKGGLQDQDPYLLRKFEILASLDRQRRLAYEHIKLSTPDM